MLEVVADFCFPNGVSVQAVDYDFNKPFES